MNKKLIFVLLPIFTIIGLLLWLFESIQSEAKPFQRKIEYIHNQGSTQGTTYSATYQQPAGIDLQSKIEARLHQFDSSLSSYIPNSIISRINRNDKSVNTDLDFETMFDTAMETARQTNGALDITVGPLVKAWGFAFGNKNHDKLPVVSDYLPYIGYKKVRIVNHKLIKDDARIMIDANGIAQGQSSDIIAKLLEANGCKNYMIEIGGEVACKGLSPSNAKWRIGIDKAIDDTTNTNNGLQAVVEMSSGAMTTAGNYRKFYIKDGKKYAHIINPHTGMPVNHNLLSATVIAPTALLADAYDTAFMVIGVDSSLAVCKRVPGLECYLIYVDEAGNNQVVYSPGFKKYLAK